MKRINDIVEERVFHVLIHLRVEQKSKEDQAFEMETFIDETKGS